MKNFKELSEVLKDNILKESTGIGDMATWGSLMIPLIEKIYPDTLVSQIADVQPLKTPVGRIAALYTYYSGAKDDIEQEITIANGNDPAQNIPLNVFMESSAVIAIAGDQTAVVSGGQTITDSVSGGSWPVLYYEVKTIEQYDLLTNPPTTSVPTEYGAANINNSTGTIPTSGDFQAMGITQIDGPRIINNNTYTYCLIANVSSTNNPYARISTVNGSLIQMVTKNRTAIRKYFFNYSGKFLTDLNNSMNYVDFNTRAVTVETNTRKILSNVTMERLTDLKNIYGENYLNVVSNIIAHEIKSEIDKEVIDYVRSIAKPMNDISLAYSLGIKASTMLDMSSDLVTNINMAVEDIVRATRRNRTMFVLADSATIGYIKVNPWHVKVEAENDNPFRVGTIGPYPLFCDMYSSDNYILIGYMFDSTEAGDAGLIFAPYTHTITETEKLGFKRIMSMNRYAYTRHPQDTGTGLGDSDFFRIFKVEFSGVTPLTPGNDVFDIPNLTKNLINYL